MLDFAPARSQSYFLYFMRSSKIRSRLGQKQAVRFACMYYPTTMMPAHAAKAGFDALWLDAEHNTWDRREIQRMIALHHLADIDCIIRTGSRNPNELYHLLEDGATALMIPMVNARRRRAPWSMRSNFFPWASAVSTAPAWTTISTSRGRKGTWKRPMPKPSSSCR